MGQNVGGLFLQIFTKMLSNCGGDKLSCSSQGWDQCRYVWSIIPNGARAGIKLEIQSSLPATIGQMVTCFSLVAKYWFWLDGNNYYVAL